MEFDPQTQALIEIRYKLDRIIELLEEIVDGNTQTGIEECGEIDDFIK